MRWDAATLNFSGFSLVAWVVVFILLRSSDVVVGPADMPLFRVVDCLAIATGLIWSRSTIRWLVLLLLLVVQIHSVWLWWWRLAVIIPLSRPSLHRVKLRQELVSI